VLTQLTVAYAWYQLMFIKQGPK